MNIIPGLLYNNTDEGRYISFILAYISDIENTELIHYFFKYVAVTPNIVTYDPATHLIVAS